LPLAASIVRAAVSMVFVPVPSMVEEMQQGACQDEQIWKGAQQMCPVFRPQEKSCHSQEAGQSPFPAAALVFDSIMLVHAVHDVPHNPLSAMPL
jgi:hypothetical protein